MKILLAEDDFTNRKVLQKMLEPYGEVHAAVDGVEVLKAVELALRMKIPYDVICLDIMMPRMDGNEALRRIRDMERQNDIRPANEAKVVMTTALDDPKTVFKSFYRCGATAFLVKPITREDISRTFEEIKLPVQRGVA